MLREFWRRTKCRREAVSTGELPIKIGDDRIHFVDPLQNAYQNSEKPVPTPSSSLSFPLGTQDEAPTDQTPIIIPKPNLDLPETPQAPIDDPLNHELHPPQDDSSGIPLSSTVESTGTPVVSSTPDAPSFSLETPKGSENSQKVPLTQDLVPPEIPSEGQSVLIPRPNIDVSETPIDEDTNALLNQGLLPPSDTPAGFGSPDTPAAKANENTFNNPNQDGPVVITEVHFAPKPSNGLLPPKDPLPNEISSSVADFPSSGPFGGSQNQPSFNSVTPKAPQPTVASPNRFTGSFGGSSGVLGQPGVNKPQQQIPVQVLPPNKFTGSFGGAPGVLGSGARPQINQIPVAIFHDPTGGNKPLQGPIPTQSVFTQPPKPSTVANKYQGNFGGSPGVLVSNNQYDRVAPTQQSTASLPSVAPTFASSVVEKFGADDASSTLGQTPTTQTLSQLPNLNSDYPTSSKVVQKYTGNFGGAPGILSPYDNSKN